MGLKMNKSWDAAEEQFIRDNAHLFSDEKLAQMLSVNFGRTFSVASTRKKRQRMGGLLKEGHRGYFKIRCNIDITPEI